MSITQLPTAPSRNDPSDVFNERADNWVAALPPWTDEVNALSVEIDDDATSASASAGAASASAGAASASAITALSAPGTSATSTTTVEIGVGVKSFFVQTGKDFVPGMIMVAADDADPTNNRMIGGITSYNTGSGQLDIDIDNFDGSGTKSAWTISITGKVGLDGSANIVSDTTPQLGGQLDANGHAIGDGNREILSFGETSLGVNHVKVTNAETGSGPIVSSVGDDNNIDLNVSCKGSGKINTNSSIVPNNSYIGSNKGSDLATSAFDISALSEVKKIASVSTEDSIPQDIAFNNDGSKVFIIGAFNNSIYEYNLSSEFNISTISPVQVTRSIASEDIEPSGISFNNDGSKIYIIGVSSLSIHQYNLSTPFNLLTMSTVQVSKSVASEDLVPSGMAFNHDGSFVYMIGSGTKAIYEYFLSDEFDITSISALQGFAPVSTENNAPTGIILNRDSSKIYMVGRNLANINEYNLTIPSRLSSISAVVSTRFVSLDDSDPTGIAFDSNGSKLFLIGDLTNSIYEYNIGESFNLIAISPVQTQKSVASEDTDPHGISFNNDGSKIYMVGSQNNSIYEYNLSTAFTLATISTVQATKSISSEDVFPTGITFNNDGSKIYMCGVQNSSVHEYNLSNNFNLLTMSPVISSVSVATEDTQPEDLVFNNDGTKVYVIGSENNSVYEYNLTIPYSTATLSPVQVTKDLSSDGINKKGLSISNDGLKLFTVNSSNDNYHQYNMTTPFELSTLSTLKVSKATPDMLPRGLTFNNNGTKIFLVGTSSELIYEHNLSPTSLTVGADGDYFDVPGTTGFSGVVVDQNRNFTLKFNDILTIIVGNGIALNNAGNDYTTSPGDIINCQSTENNVIVGSIVRSDGKSLTKHDIGPFGTFSLIGSIEANNNATLTIIGLDSRFTTYVIKLSLITPAILPSAILQVRTGTSSGGIDSAPGDYSHHTSMCVSTSTSYIAATPIDTSVVLGEVVGSVQSYVSAMLYLTRPITAGPVTISGTVVSKDVSVSGGHIIGERVDNTLVDRVQVFFSSSDIISGTFTIWGISNA